LEKNREVSENLPNYGNVHNSYCKCFGKLVVNNDNWQIEFTLPGPDGRYNPTYKVIKSDQIQSYIDAYRSNWATYCILKEKLGNSTIGVIVDGVNDMTIRIKEYPSGVCIDYYKLPLRTEEEVEKMISDLKWAKNRALELKELISFI
jgi:hypothetical protein